jgi:phosphatidylinositol 3-kinase
VCVCVCVHVCLSLVCERVSECLCVLACAAGLPHVPVTAGYVVITYVLGVGDRHLDNLLLKSDGTRRADRMMLSWLTHWWAGTLFHIDFSFLFGRDPKPFAPSMKISEEMIAAMGGRESALFSAFKTHAKNAFITLRRNARLFSSLLALMVNADIQDVSAESSKVLKKVRDNHDTSKWVYGR